MRLRTMAIFGIGYLVGTRSGQDRYQQIVGSVRELAESDVVRGYADRALDLARRTVEPAGSDVSVEDGETGEDEEETSTGDARTGARRSG